MEFPFPIDEILPGRTTVVESEDLSSILKIYDLDSLNNSHENKDKNWICNLSSNIIWDVELRKKKEQLENVIDAMGLASAQAQSLLSPITTFKKLLNSSQQKILIIRDIEKLHCVIGILKIGVKRLFICDDIGAHHEIDAKCVLDFYVHESRQRCGFGHELFELMIKLENISPEKLAIDRPSPKFLSFLKKHYNLSDPISQANNFVVYPGFLNDRSVTRPPIFLYYKKESQLSDLSSSEDKSYQKKKISASLNTFNTVPISLSCEKAKSKSFYSSNCHHRGHSNSTLDSYYKKKRTTNIFPNNDVRSSHPSTSQRKWGVYDALHSYSQEDSNFNARNGSQFDQCSLTPVSSTDPLSPKQSTELQSSWNILGVKPIDYSMINKNT